MGVEVELDVLYEDNKGCRRTLREYLDDLGYDRVRRKPKGVFHLTSSRHDGFVLVSKWIHKKLQARFADAPIAKAEGRPVAESKRMVALKTLQASIEAYFRSLDDVSDFGLTGRELRSWYYKPLNPCSFTLRELLEDSYDCVCGEESERFLASTKHDDKIAIDEVIYSKLSRYFTRVVVEQGNKVMSDAIDTLAESGAPVDDLHKWLYAKQLQELYYRDGLALIKKLEDTQLPADRIEVLESAIKLERLKEGLGS